MNPTRVVIRQLVEDMLVTGRSAEDVCCDHPDLVEEVRQLWERARAVQEHVGAIFPSAESLSAQAHSTPESQSLPQIPGYDVQALLGYGGMGVVYRAQHLSLNRTVAIKMPLAGAFASASERQRHKREAQALAALGHPNIITVHDVGEVDGHPYFTMEFVDGPHLGLRLSNTPQPAREAAELLATLADAVECAHRAGIVHRDLKPANVLLSPDGSPKITDFGLARRVERGATVTAAGFQLGTPSYMSPEQARGDPALQSPRVDVYSLGAILYEMLTGRPPFRGETVIETLRQVLEDEPAPPSRLNPKTPRDLETISLTCLHKDPRRRYPSAQAFAEDLRRFLRGEPIHARPVGTFERIYRWVRRRPATAAAWLGAAATLAAVLGVMAWTASERAATQRAVVEDLAEVVRLEKRSEWSAARNMLERAKTRLGASAAGHPLAQRASALERELDLVDRLVSMRIERLASQQVRAESEADSDRPWREYRAVFRDAGLLLEGDTPETFAERVANSPARSALLDAMDDWAVCAVDPSACESLLSATRLANPDPSWRDRVRNMATWSDADALVALSREAEVESQSVTLLLTVAGLLHELGSDEGERFLRKIQAAHPHDFWANFALAEVLAPRLDPDALGYYRAAIAVRPDSAGVYASLANAMADQGRFGDAIEQMQRTAALAPNSFPAHYNLAIWLLRENRFAEALEHGRDSVRVAPEAPEAHRVLGRAFAMVGDFCAAAGCFDRAVELAPDDTKLRELLALATSKCETSGE